VLHIPEYRFGDEVLMDGGLRIIGVGGDGAAFARGADATYWDILRIDYATGQIEIGNQIRNRKRLAACRAVYAQVLTEELTNLARLDQ